MVKPWLLFAFAAQTFFLASSTGISQRFQHKKHGRSPSQTQYYASSTQQGFAAGSYSRGHAYPPLIKCKKLNEVYDPCPAPCQYRTCGINDAAVSCAQALPYGHPKCAPPKCRCKDGFFRNDVGNCVRWENCPKCPRPNEIYDPCIAPCPPRRCDVDELLINCAESPKLGDPLCKAGCRCADGYVTNYEGICIPKEECPKCTNPHEVFDPCPTACPQQTCESIGKKCKKKNRGGVEENNGAEVCDGKCVCEKGYFRNKIGECISQDDCLKCTGPYEYFSCGPECDNVCELLDQQNQTHCPLVNIVCNEKCYCEKGYARDENNICIPIEDCEASCGGDRNKIAGCGVYCNQRCRDVGMEPRACIDICFDNECDCREGTYLDENTGYCVPPEDCTPQCPENEWYSECIQGNCSPQNCSQVGFPMSCPRINRKYCKEGCLCKEGYVRNDNGICIRTTECPSCGGDANKIAGCGVYCNQLCEDVGKEPRICIQVCNENACNCREGTFLDKNTGFCVPPEECSPQCPDNEVYSECTQGGCSPQNCSQVGFPIACRRINTKYCKKGCVCQEGYARNENGICIPSKECPSCGGDPNAEAGCGGNCNRKCSNIGKEPEFCTLICEINGCNCKGGYYFDDNTKKCVKPEQCTPQCPENEWYSKCIQGNCSPQNCSQVGFSISCPRINRKYCKEGCLCKEGYVRNDNGICIRTTECPSCGGDANKIAGCGVYCNQLCEDVGKEPRICIQVCNENACNCREGTFLDKNTGFCVPPEECSPQCPDNEVYSECTQGGCSPQNCSQVGFPIACRRINTKYCKKGCVCQEGYARNENGICIPSKECPSCGGDPNAEAGCGGNCNRKCSNIGKEPEFCTLICEINGCNCKGGYYFDDNTKKCVKPEQCTPVCLDVNNEVYSDCINGGCEAKNCSQYDKPVPCPKIDFKNCIEGCLCKQGYLRASNGKCVPERDCPEACTGPNEEYNECSRDCPPQICESLDMVYTCPIADGNDCKPMCRCKSGYYRNKIGQCITEEQCRRCMGPHEFYSCGGACDNICETLHEQNQTNCPFINIKCNEMCYCEKGYARAKNKTCIPIGSCNEPQCPINERFEECPAASCEPKHCSQLGYPIPCPVTAADGRCPQKPGCVCIDGYVRDDNGKCIPKKECPSCRGDSHAQSGCGVNCGKHCRDLVKNGVPCIKICFPNSCDCKDGYYYDSYQKKCVLAGQCTDICGKNEVFEDCSDPICRAKNCTELGFELDCDSECSTGCVCKEGFARNNKGICIPEKKCSSCGGDSNVESGCGVNCLKKCYDLQNPDRPRPCPRICNVNACDCKKGYYLDENIDKCVLPENCTPSCGKDEIYTPCANGGCDKTNCSQLSEPQLCKDPMQCIGGCICKEGFLRLQNGTCVPYDQCPTPKCKKHERFELCPAKVCQPQSCWDLGYPIDCTDIDDPCPGYPGCVCDYNYVRNDKGICRPKSECSSCKGDLNAQSGCGINCGKRCPNNNLNTKLCPRICLPNACDCKDGFYYDSNVKLCVELEDCSPRCDELNNEIYDPCVNDGCGSTNCSEVEGPILYTDPNKCIKGCSCKEGYYRLNNGTCVPEDECPQWNMDSLEL